MPSTVRNQVNDVQVCEAGFVQRREWMLYQINDDHYPFNLKLDFELNRFDHRLFQQVLDAMVKKHEILRTTLRVIDGSLKQVIHSPVDFPVGYTFYDISSRDPQAQRAFVREKLLVQLKTAFNFAYGPLFRVFVVASSKERFEVVFIFHHVIFDLYSAEIFKQDAVEIYQLIEAGKAWDAPVVQAQYKQYASFENALLDTDAGASHREYWKAQLSLGVPQLLLADAHQWEVYYRDHLKKVQRVIAKIKSLPVYDLRFSASVIRRSGASRAGSLAYGYKEETFKNLSAFKQKCNSSLHALFVASFLTALQKLSGQQIFGFDIPAVRRVDGEHKNIIGWLAAGGVCFFNLSENSSARNFLHYIDRQLYLLARHCIYPFEAVAQETEVPVGSTMPVLFTLSEVNNPSVHNPGDCGFLSHEHESTTCYQHIDVYLTVYNNCCHVQVLYNSFLFSPGLIEKLMVEQECSLNAIVREIASRELVVL